MISPVKIWRHQKKIRKVLGSTGKIVSFTKIHVPPAGFISQAPYVVAIAEFQNGERFTAQLVEWNEENLTVGQKIVTVLRRTREADAEGVIPYGVKFKAL